MHRTGAHDVVEYQAHTLRALALSAWESGESAAVVANLLLGSCESFEHCDSRSDAAVSISLAGLVLSDAPDPVPALSFFEASLPELQRSGPPFLVVLAALGEALCLATLQRPSEALAILRSPSVPILHAPDEILAAQWLHARASALLGHHPDPLRHLETLFERFLDNRRFTEALLAALDVCQLGSANSARWNRLEALLEASLPTEQPHPTRLRAFRTLTADLRSGLPFRRAAGAFPVLVPSFHRFSINSLVLSEDALR